jgi:hypothetical protein
MSSNANYIVRHNRILASIAGNYAAGTCLVQTTAGDFVISTSANRATYNRKSDSIMLTAGDGTRRQAVDVQFCGDIPPAISGVGAGTQDQWVRVSATGFLERVTSPGGSDDVIGKADADGTVRCLFGGLVSTASGGGTPAGGTGAVQYNNAGAFAAIAPNAAFGKPLVSNGAGVPPIYSEISLANDDAVTAPGNANEILFCSGFGLAVSAATNVKAAATYLSIGATPSTSGLLRFPYAATASVITAKDSGGTDRDVLSQGGANVWRLGLAGAFFSLQIYGDFVDIYGNSGTRILNKSGSGYCVELYQTSSDHLNLGATPAASGVLRLANAVSAMARNAANSADFGIFGTDSSNVLYVGADAAAANACTHLRTHATSTAGLVVGGTYFYYANGSTLEIGVPLQGSSLFSNTFRLKSAAITKNDATDLTLSNVQYSCPIIEINGTPGGAYNIIAPNTVDSVFWLRNNTASAATIKKSGGTGVVVAANKAAQVWHNGTDYVRLTPDA